MYNSEILSYEISKRPTLEPILKALYKAIAKTDKNKEKRIFHSDQVWAYQVQQYTSRLESKRIIQSMSRKGNCLDNSPIEKYIKYYNEERIKEKLGYLSPVEFRKKNAA